MFRCAGSGPAQAEGKKTLSTALRSEGTPESVPPVAAARRELSSADALHVVLSSLDEAKAEDPISIDLAGKTTIGDHMVIASGRSDRHVSAIAHRLIEDLKKAGGRDIRVEGLRAADWVLVDAGDVIVHIFRPEVRAFYNIEKMWRADHSAVPVAAQA